MKYICSNGDTWDSISYKVYGDEFLFVQIMEINREYNDVVMFAGGEAINIPDRIILENSVISSPWQTGAKVGIITAPW